MQLVLLVIGLILVFVPTLFASAATVGWICLAVFVAITVVQLAAFLIGVHFVNKQSSSFRSRW